MTPEGPFWEAEPEHQDYLQRYPERLHLPLPAAGLEAAPPGRHVVTGEPAADYPQMAAERGRVEPAPRRVRGYVDGVLVFDTVAARYVWEVPYYPQYYVR